MSTPIWNLFVIVACLGVLWLPPRIGLWSVLVIVVWLIIGDTLEGMVQL